MVLCIAIAVLAKWPVTFVQAAGLGPITLYSRLGESLDAEILLTDVSVADADKLKAYLADETVFQQSNIEKQSVLQHLRMAVVHNSANELVVKLSSVKPISEPFVNLIVELAWPSGTFLREYTFLLDPAVQASTALSPAPTTDQTNPQAQRQEQSQAKPQRQAQSEAFDQEQHPYLLLVKSGDNLLEIARRIAPDNISVEQAAIAIFRANASAFYGSIDQLNAGAELLIPTVELMSELTKSEAVLAVQSSRKRVRQTTDAAIVAASVDTDNSALLENLKTQPKNTSSSLQANAQSNSPLEIDASVIDQQRTKNDIALQAVADHLAASGSQAMPAASITSQAVLLDNNVDRKSLHSVAELRNIIADLAGALLHLRENLDEKSNQLAQLSNTLDSLAQKPSATTEQAAVAQSANSTQALSDLSAKQMNASAIASSAIKTLAETGTVVDPSVEGQPPELVGDTFNSKAREQQGSTNKQSVENKVVDTVVAMADTADEQARFSKSQVGKKKAELATQESTITIGGSESGSSLTVPLPTVKEKSNHWLKWFYEESQNRRVAGLIRDAGFIFLATLLGYIVVRRLWLRRTYQLAHGAEEIDVRQTEDDRLGAQQKEPSESFDPLSAIEYFRQQLTSEQHKEESIRKKLELNPDDQDARMNLLQLYYERQAVELFEATARDMYKMTGGKNPHWHKVIELGLSLDTDMQFYLDPKTMDNGNAKFDFDDKTQPIIDHSVASVPGGTDDGIESALYAPNSNENAKPIIEDVAQDKSEEKEVVDIYEKPDQEHVDFEVTEFGLQDIDVELDVENLISTDTTLSNYTQDNELVDLVKALNSHEQGNATAASGAEAEVTPWKEAEIKLDLAVVYKDIGNIDGARILLNEVVSSGDSTQVQVARALLSKLR